MLIPVEVIFSGIKGGVYETQGSKGWYWRKGKLVAKWAKNKQGKLIVTWYNRRNKNV